MVTTNRKSPAIERPKPCFFLVCCICCCTNCSRSHLTSSIALSWGGSAAQNFDPLPMVASERPLTTGPWHCGRRRLGQPHQRGVTRLQRHYNLARLLGLQIDALLRQLTAVAA